MCGIAGIWQPDGPPIGDATTRRFIRALAHRGPDGEGIAAFDAGRLALAHRRLAILDRSDASAQPMRSSSGRYHITYNGEVYNFLELRAELESHGVRFRSDGDTEVVLAAFERWGAACLPRFNGMWAFAIWDAQDRRLFLSRDRFGVKPLYVAHLPGNRFAFASELKAFLHLDGFEPDADTAVITARLNGNFSDGVLLRGVTRVPPGHCLEVTPTASRHWRWWRTLDHLVDVPRGRAAQADAFRALLFDACRMRLRADVPVATSLSGGLDSSSVLVSMAAAEAQARTTRQAPEWRRAFIAGFTGTSQDEIADAELAAGHAGVATVVQSMSAGDVHADVDAFLYQFEEIGGLYGIGAWTLYREMRRAGAVISIDGHGGDELLGGYDVHVLSALARGRGLLTAPRRTLDLLATWRGMRGRGSRLDLADVALFAASVAPGVLPVLRALPMSRGRTRFLLDAIEQHSSARTPAGDAARADDEAIDALGPLTGALYRSFHDVSLPRILRNFDAHAMGHGVEVRMPLLDWRLVCFAFSVPDDSKAGGRYTKRLLRDAMHGLLPDRIRQRRDKLGYNAPVAEWLNGALGAWIRDMVNEPDFVRSELWDGPALRAMTMDHRSGAPWHDGNAQRVALAATAHWWQTRWLRASVARVP